jgi:hypothetical protein
LGSWGLSILLLLDPDPGEPNPQDPCGSETLVFKNRIYVEQGCTDPEKIPKFDFSTFAAFVTSKNSI